MKKEELIERVQNLENLVDNMVEVLKPLAIGNEQLWEVVFRDLIKAPVPDGVDLRTLVEKL